MSDPVLQNIVSLIEPYRIIQFIGNIYVKNEHFCPTQKVNNSF